MAKADTADSIPLLISVALLSWLVPGAGHFLLKERKRSVIIFVTIAATFCIGLFIGSIAVIDPVSAKPWYFAQILASPFVAVLGHLTAAGNRVVYGWTNEIGQIYTSNITTSASMTLWLLPLAASIAVIYKVLKLPKIKPVNFIKETAVLFGSIMVFLVVSAVVLFLVAWLVV